MSFPHPGILPLLAIISCVGATSPPPIPAQPSAFVERKAPTTARVTIRDRLWVGWGAAFPCDVMVVGEQRSVLGTLYLSTGNAPELDAAMQKHDVLIVDLAPGTEEDKYGGALLIRDPDLGFWKITRWTVEANATVDTVLVAFARQLKDLAELPDGHHDAPGGDASPLVGAPRPLIAASLEKYASCTRQTGNHFESVPCATADEWSIPFHRLPEGWVGGGLELRVRFKDGVCVDANWIHSQ